MLAFAVIIALNQLQIGAEIVNTLFMAVVGMIALATALAFGLGGREVAGRILEGWYARRGEVADQASRLADAAQHQSASGNGPSRPPAPAAPAYTVSPAGERRGA